MSITSKFASQFDPTNSAHVLWLSKFFNFAENLATKRLDVETILNANPMGIHVKKEEMLDWVQIHFTISMKYSRAVLLGKAFIPDKSSQAPS